MKKSLAFVTVLFALTCTGLAQSRYRLEEKDTIRRTLEFSSGAGAKILEVDNVEGSIHVTGYEGRDVEMTASKTIRAESQNEMQTAKQEVKLDITDKADTVQIYIDQPGHRRSTTSSRHSDWHDRGYRVTFDFEIRVPRQAAIHLWTVNDGDIQVQNTAGDFEVKNINGRVEMHEISGSGRAHTINGAVKVAFSNNPKGTSYFGSLNGDVDVTFQPSLSADLRFKTFNGGVYTDFPITALPRAIGTGERRNGKFVYKTDQFSSARIGNGGPEITFDGFNGNVRILRAR